MVQVATPSEDSMSTRTLEPVPFSSAASGMFVRVKAQIGKPKFEFESMEVDHDLFDAVEAMVGEQVKVALDTDDKNVRDARLQPIIDAVHVFLLNVLSHWIISTVQATRAIHNQIN